MSEQPVIDTAEDDQTLRGFLEDTLSDAGSEAATAASGEEAFILTTDHKVHYRALVTDINLDGRLDGWQVAQPAREIDRAFPFIYISGAHAEDWGDKGVPNSIILAKPFAPAQLVTAIAQLLNAAPGSALPLGD